MVAAKYCQLIPQDTKEVPAFWKIVHVLCLAVAVISSFSAAVEAEIISVDFGHQCVLYPTLKFVPKDKSLYELVGNLPLNDSFHTPQTTWGNPSLCSFCRGSYLFSMTLAIIMLAFFIIIPKGGSGATLFMYSDAWHLIPFALCMATIMLIFVIIAYCYTHFGLRALITQITDYLVEHDLCDPGSCAHQINLFSLIYFQDIRPLTRHFIISRISSTAALFSWVALIVTLVIRIALGIDFKVIIYKIRPMPPIDDTNSSISDTSYNIYDEIPVLKKQSYVNIKSLPSSFNA